MRMFPREFPARRRKKPKRRAEREVYEALAGSDRRGFSYYEWRRGYERIELDFAVWVEGLGRFALQVKGGHYLLIDGEWYLQTREGIRPVRSCPLAGTQPSVTVRNGRSVSRGAGPPRACGRLSLGPSPEPCGQRCSPGAVVSHYPQGARPAGLPRGSGGRHRNWRQGPCLPQPPPQLRSPLAAVRPERQRRLCLAGPQQSDHNPQHLQLGGVKLYHRGDA